MTALSNVANFRIEDSELVDGSISSTRTNVIFGTCNGGYLEYFIKRPFESVISIASMNSISIDNLEIINTIKSFSYLEYDWDGEGAKAISPISIKRCIEIVKKFDLLNLDIYLASPGPNEEILLLIKKNTKELEIIVYPHKMKFVKFDKNEFISQGDFSMEEIQSLYIWTRSE